MAYNVPDQFEVEPTAIYSGSYTDVVMVGTLGSTTGRYAAAYQASGSAVLSLLSKTGGGITYSEYAKNLLDYNIGVNRFAQFFCPTETYYDSLVFNPVDVLGIDSGIAGIGALFLSNGNLDAVTPWSFSNNLKFQLGFTDVTITGSNTITVTDTDWLCSFPFQGRYSSLSRLQHYPSITSNNRSFTESTSSGDMTYVAGGSTTLNDPTQIGIEFLSLSGSGKLVRNLVEVSGSVSSPALAFVPNSYLPASYPTLYLAFYGFGDGFRRQPNFMRELSGSLSGSFSNTRYSYNYVQGPIIRGFKYGIFNALPTVSKAVWRKGKFGQLRDQLEQRPYTKFYNLLGESVRGRSIGKKGPTSAVTTVTFTSGTADYITASMPTTLNTRDSGLYNFEYCSGQPFSDV